MPAYLTPNRTAEKNEKSKGKKLDVARAGENFRDSKRTLTVVLPLNPDKVIKERKISVK